VPHQGAAPRQEDAMAKYEISLEDPPERWLELYASIAAEAELPELAEEELGVEVASIFFPAWHVL
jgi:hypothetical protein